MYPTEPLEAGLQNTGRPGPDLRVSISSPVLIGRGAELARLGYALDRAAADVPADIVDGVQGGSRP
jgi:hypothetical protein